jgi:hypothetical protein
MNQSAKERACGQDHGVGLECHAHLRDHASHLAPRRQRMRSPHSCWNSVRFGWFSSARRTKAL